MNQKRSRLQAVPDLLLIVGFFLIAESLTFTIIAARRQGYHVDIFDFAFVFIGALIVTMIGVFEKRRLNPGRGDRAYVRALLFWGIVGVVLGVAGGFIAIWLSGLAY